MGLDMYLYKINREALMYMKYDPDDVKESNPALYLKMKPYLTMKGDPRFTQFESLFEEIGYWRKANQIHRWFVEHVQDGVDECDRYEVTKEQLTELRDLSIKVLTESVMMEGIIRNGYTFNINGKKTTNYRKGKTVINPEIAIEFLPTLDGFFFGSTDYDEIYIEDLQETVNILNNVLEQTDFSNYAVFYRSSW